MAHLPRLSMRGVLGPEQGPAAPGDRAWLTETPMNRLAAYSIIAGVVTGVLVAGVNWAVILTERAVFGVDHLQVLSPAESVTPTRLAITLIGVGIVTAVLWFLLDRFGRPQVAVPGAMQGKDMPVVTTLLSAFLQVCSSAAGAPIGRENAPRLVGGLAAAGMATTFRLDGEARKILVASAAGAGLAASFHLPLAGALFALELLLVEMSTRTVIATMVCSATAVATTSLLFDNPPFYVALPLTEGPRFLLAAVIVGAVAGSAGHFFGRIALRMAAHHARGVSLLWQMPLAFIVVAAVARVIPGASSNGRWAVQTTLDMGVLLSGPWDATGRVMLASLALLFLARTVLTLLCFRVGTIGGTLTPAFAMGGTIGAAVGIVMQPLFPDVAVGAFALMGAAAFLCTTMAAPMFSMLAAVELTDMPSQGYLAMFVAVIAASLATRAWAVITDKEHRVLPFTSQAWTGESL